MELEIQKFLRSRTSGIMPYDPVLDHRGVLKEIEERWGINSRAHGEFPSLLLFKYDQIESPMGEKVVQECRGLILDSADNWNIVAFPFTKFFNYGEGHAAQIEWSSARVQEKLDGSLCVLSWHHGRWNVSTSGSPDASGNVNDQGFTFKDLFWKTFNEMGLKVPSEGAFGLTHEYTFMFELMTPYNRVVVRHEKPRLVLIGVRKNKTGQESYVSKWCGCYPVVQEFPLQSFDQILATFDTMDPLKQEGYVVVDAQFNRVKVKSPAYVAFHHLKDSLTATKKNVVEIIRRGESTEFTTHFPEYKADFDDAQARFEQLVADLEAFYAPIKDIEVQKDFALEAVKSRVSGCLFSLRKGQVGSVRQYLAEMQIDKLVGVLGL